MPLFPESGEGERGEGEMSECNMDRLTVASSLSPT